MSSRYVDLFDFCYFCITVIAHCARVQTVTVCFIAVLFIKCFVYCVNKLSRCCFGWNVNRLDFTLDFLEMTVQCSCTPTVQFAVVWRLKLTEELTAFLLVAWQTLGAEQIHQLGSTAVSSALYAAGDMKASRSYRDI